MNVMNKLKGTGRTTRMMEDATHHVLEGKTVYVLVRSMDHASILRRAYPPLGFVFHTPATIAKIMEPLTMKLPSHYKNTVLLVDHAVMEEMLAPALEMLHRYDPPEFSQ